MNYTELRAKATKGPLRASERELLRKDDITIAYCHGHIHGPHAGQAEANAAMLAHCYNHFDEVVEALGTFIDRMADLCVRLVPEYSDAMASDIYAANAVLARAKEVK